MYIKTPLWNDPQSFDPVSSISEGTINGQRNAQILVYIGVVGKETWKNNMGPMILSAGEGMFRRRGDKAKEHFFCLFFSKKS